MTEVKSCKVKDCLFNDKEDHCTTVDIELNNRGTCLIFIQDKAWLDKSLHKYVWYPIFDGYTDYAPVAVEDESI